MENKSTEQEPQQALRKTDVMCRFFKRFTFWKIIGLSVALLAWVGDFFFGWQSNIGYYFLGAIASWCVSENEAKEYYNETYNN